MLGFILRRFRVGNSIIKLSSSTQKKWGTPNPINITTHLHFLHNNSLGSQNPHEEKEEEEEEEEEEEGKPIQKNNSLSSLTLSYLINSCGLSPQSALSASQKITIKTTEKPDSVINAFKSYGFTNTQIEKMITKLPILLSSNPNVTIIPKLQFFLDIGYADTQLTELITSSPHLLRPSLENRIRPNFNLLKSVLNSNQQLVAAIRRASRGSCLLTNNLETNFLPNVRVLQGYGVPASNIAKLATLNPRALTVKTAQFKGSVESIKNMGFNPFSTLFLHGIHVALGMSATTWKRKADIFKSLGWAEEEVISAFVKQPFCMGTSEERIRQSMDFFVKKMHWRPSVMAAQPVILKLSLEKRVIPRCSVFNILVSKGLVKNSYPKFLLISERDFLNNYVNKYQDRVPEVLQAYNGHLDFVGPKGESTVIQ